jgi:hypothetical protein
MNFDERRRRDSIIRAQPAFLGQAGFDGCRNDLINRSSNNRQLSAARRVRGRMRRSSTKIPATRLDAARLCGMGMGALTVAGLLVAVLKSQLVAMIDRQRRSATQQEAVARIGRRSLADADDAGLAGFAAAEVRATVGANDVLILRRPMDEDGFVVDAAVGLAVSFGGEAAAAAEDALIRSALRGRGAV